jgi:hypothetical protein
MKGQEMVASNFHLQSGQVPDETTQGMPPVVVRTIRTAVVVGRSGKAWAGLTYNNGDTVPGIVPEKRRETRAEEVVAEGDRVAGRFSLRGTHTGTCSASQQPGRGLTWA